VGAGRGHVGPTSGEGTAPGALGEPMGPGP
jgi:hypothetical protein